MRKLFLAMATAWLLGSSSGCIIPIYSGDPAQRAEQLIYTSENLRLLTEDWERIWFLDQPSHLTPWRT
ncbi:MAG: hypothetical protein KDA63_18185, partial [Planctomycetales bacterium]|nr:hypothetical protein [Planctomycetales bacterium]